MYLGQGSSLKLSTGFAIIHFVLFNVDDFEIQEYETFKVYRLDCLQMSCYWIIGEKKGVISFLLASCEYFAKMDIHKCVN